MRQDKLTSKFELALADEEPVVRLAAADALSRLRESGAVDELGAPLPTVAVPSPGVQSESTPG